MLAAEIFTSAWLVWSVVRFALIGLAASFTIWGDRPATARSYVQFFCLLFLIAFACGFLEAAINNPLPAPVRVVVVQH